MKLPEIWQSICIDLPFSKNQCPAKTLQPNYTLDFLVAVGWDEASMTAALNAYWSLNRLLPPWTVMFLQLEIISALLPCHAHLSDVAHQVPIDDRPMAVSLINQ
jgi:hypothetical protein